MEFPISCSIAFVCIDPGWAQVYVNIALAILTFLTLIVLCIYAWDTRRIANISMEQFNSSQTPVLALVQKVRNSDLVWAIENQGNSAAFNIKIEGDYDSIETTKDKSCKHEQNTIHDPVRLENHNTIPAGKHEALDCPRYARNEQITWLKIEYDSLEGHRFVTDVVSENGTLVTKFKAL